MTKHTFSHIEYSFISAFSGGSPENYITEVEGKIYINDDADTHLAGEIHYYLI